jgi:hypothetical protein
MEEHKSQGDWLKFVENVSKGPNANLINGFFNVYYKEKVTAEDLLKFFQGVDYDGVSLEDCEKLLGFLENVRDPKTGRLPWDFDIKKY